MRILLFLAAFPKWFWRRPCVVCERSHWPELSGRFGQYAAMGSHCPSAFHRRHYARWR